MFRDRGDPASPSPSTRDAPPGHAARESEQETDATYDEAPPLPPRNAMTASVTRADYLTAALTLLATEGYGALKVGRLCRELGITTGSFYHHFSGLPDLVTSLLAHWEEENTRRVAMAVVEITAPDQAIGVLKEVAIALPHAAEANLRAWSLRDPAIARVVARVDEERRSVLTAAIALAVGEQQRAHDLAVLGHSVLIGFQQSRDPRDLVELRRLMDLYERLIHAEAAVAAVAAG